MTELSEKARLARNKYSREYHQRNPDKIKEYNIRYWEKKSDPTYPIRSDVKKLSKQGLTQQQIADRLLLSIGTVNNYLNKV